MEMRSFLEFTALSCSSEVLCEISVISSRVIFRTCTYSCGTALPLLKISSSPVFFKVGGIAPLGAILMGKGAKKTKGAIGERNNTKGDDRERNNTKGAKMHNH